MTQEQSSRYDLLACVPRCLIHFCNSEGHQITTETFCRDYEKYFTDQAENYGLLEGDNFRDVCRLLPIGEPLYYDGRYEVILQHFTPGRKQIFMFSKVNLQAGETDGKKHLSIITDMTAERFSIWTPYQGKTDGPMHFERKDWELKQCLVVIFR